MDKYLGDDELQYLRTKHNYRKLNRGLFICQDDAFYNKAKNILERNNGLHAVSDKILNALCYVYKNSLWGTLDDDFCNFLYFWLGDILLKKLEKNIFFQDIISNLFKTLTNDNNDKICQLPHIFSLKEDFKDTKLIFDCSEDYKNYKVKHIYHRMSCNNNYKTHLDTNIKNYDMFYSHCEVEKRGHKYCEAFRKYFPNNEQNLFSEFNCSLELNEPKSEKFAEGDENEFVQSQGEKSNRGSPEEEKLSVGHRSRVESLAVPHESSVTKSETDGFQILGSSDHSDGTPSSMTSKSITGAVSVAGALVPSYLLYSYTPAGNLINKLLGRTTRVNHNPLTDAQLINNFYQHEGFNSERSGYNISYRPV